MKAGGGRKRRRERRKGEGKEYFGVEGGELNGIVYIRALCTVTEACNSRKITAVCLVVLFVLCSLEV